MRKRELLARIEELEQQVEALQARVATLESWRWIAPWPYYLQPPYRTTWGHDNTDTTANRVPEWSYTQSGKAD